MQAVRSNGCKTSLSAAYRRRCRPADVQHFHSSTPRTLDTTSEGAQKPQAIDHEAYSSVTINPENKTVETAVGELPISPLMDLSFHEARGKYTKPKAMPAQFKQQKWQRQLARNPYAKALATPVRRCIISSTNLPSFFLQRFTLVSHPETGKPWFTPYDLGSKVPAAQVEPNSTEDESPETAAAKEPNPAHDAETAPSTSSPSETASQQQEQQQHAPETEQQQQQTSPRGPKFPPPTPRTGPSAYVLSHQRLLRELQLPSSRYHQHQRRLLRANDRGQGRLTGALDAANWRADMDGVLLAMLRRRVVEGLVYFAGLVRGEGEGEGGSSKYVVRCEGWEGVKGLGHRGCLLFLGGEDGGGNGFVPPRLSTMDVGAVKFGRRVPVHNLDVILGEEHVARLRQESALFRDGSLFMLARQATVNLQMLLWKLQGYMAWEELPEPYPPGQKPKAKPELTGEE